MLTPVVLLHFPSPAVRVVAFEEKIISAHCGNTLMSTFRRNYLVQCQPTLYNALPLSPTVITCKEASVPSQRSRPWSCGMGKVGRQIVPFPVSLYGMAFKDRLNVDVFAPIPRFIQTYVNGW